MSVLGSSQVTVFPCASRTGVYQVEARLLSEKNMTDLVKHITNSNGSFVISSDGKEFMLGGYYFKLNNDSKYSNSVYASLKFTQNNILAGDLEVLKVYYFDGLNIDSSEPGSGVWIQLWDGEKVPEKSKISFIKRDDKLVLDCGELK